MQILVPNFLPRKLWKDRSTDYEGGCRFQKQLVLERATVPLAIRFICAKRSFESRLETILTAAAGHEGNSLPPGDHQYHLLSAESESLRTEFANRWGLDIDLLKARIAGLAKLNRRSAPPQTLDYAGIALLGLFAIPVVCFLMGAVAGLVSVGRVTMNVYGEPVNDALRDASSKVAGRAISQLLTKSAS